MSDENPTGGAETEGRGATSAPTGGTTTTSTSTSTDTPPESGTDGRGATAEPSGGGDA